MTADIMTEILETKETETAIFESLQRALPADVPTFIRAIRDVAMRRFSETGLPTTRDEAWRYTNVRPLARVDYVRPSASKLQRDAIAAWTMPDAAAELVFVDGRFAAGLSRVVRESGVTAIDLAAALDGGVDDLESTLSRVATDFDRPFVALNAALLEEGAVIDVATSKLESPVHCLFVTTGTSDVLATPRIVVRARRGAELRLVETFVSLGSSRTLTDVVTEVRAEEGAVIEHLRLHEQSESDSLVSSIEVEQKRDSSYRSSVFSFGGHLVRNDVIVRLEGEGSSCTLDGLYVLGGEQHCDNHTAIEHRSPNATSSELYKGVLDGRAHGIFDGVIVVAKDAQKTSSKQTNNNLLLSREAVADSKPQLEIYADDVKCNHGSTIGQIDDDQLFYLRSRGFGESDARAILTAAFARDLIATIRYDAIRERLEKALLDRVSGEGDSR